MKIMQALVKKEPKEGLWLEEMPVPEIGINDVLIRIHKASICGTDVHIYNWDAWAQKTIPTPMVIGHEFVGTVADLGSNVHDFVPTGTELRSGTHRYARCSSIASPSARAAREGTTYNIASDAQITC